MMSRRQDENVILPRTSRLNHPSTQTSGPKKIASKENVLAPRSKPAAGSRTVDGKAGSSVGSSNVERRGDENKGKERGADPNGKPKPIRRTPLVSVSRPSTKPTVPSAKLSSTTKATTRTPAVPLRPKVGSSERTSVKTQTNLSATTPAITRGTHASLAKRVKKLTVYTPAPGPAQNHSTARTPLTSAGSSEQAKLNQEEVDEVEYMPPPAAERPYEPPSHYLPQSGMDDLGTDSLEMRDLDLDLNPSLELAADPTYLRQRGGDDSFEIAPPGPFDFDLDLAPEPEPELDLGLSFRPGTEPGDTEFTLD